MRSSECGVEAACHTPHSAFRTPHLASVVRPRRVGLDAADVHVGADEKGVAVVAELAVGGALAGVQAAEDFACGSKAINAAGAGGPDVALLIDRQAVGQAGAAFFGPFRPIVNDAALAERAVGFHG